MVRETIETPVTTYYSGSEAWTSKCDAVDLEKLRITKVDIGCDDGYITLLKFSYNQIGHSAGFQKEPQSQKWTIELDSDEWITQFDIGQASEVLAYVLISTNKKSHGPYGSPRPANTTIVKAGKDGFGALWCKGSFVDEYIASIQITWAEYPAAVSANPPPFLKFHNGSGPASFRKQLSPMITLVVGKPPSRLTVHEGIVERLPFLSKASLEETRKRLSGSTDISLPDDDAAVIVALIEYLKTGSYTYEHADPESIPAVDFAQGLFHLDLYATATKYKCPELADAALKSVIWVLSELGAVDSLKMWQAGYKHGLSLDQLEPSGYKGMKSRLKELVTTDKDAFTNLVATCPALASDLLALFATEIL
ncbi:hypothetical protein DFH27DRAFT_657105 [Peziza echinospora]|nr:hypothetical protein DFH27DRAFT_657105 [Peziza echinospora]